MFLYAKKTARGSLKRSLKVDPGTEKCPDPSRKEGYA